MDNREFVRLVGGMLEAMDQHLAAARPISEGFMVQSTDGFLFVFVPRPTRVSPRVIREWLEAGDSPAERLVVFSPEIVPEPTREEVVRGGGTVVSGPVFANLVDQLGIESPIVAHQRPAGRASPHFLPTAERLEEIMGRAENWKEAGVPVLALRFFRQAVALKPEYVPAWSGVAQSLCVLGLWNEAHAAWEELLALQPGNIDARLGLCLIHGALGEDEEEARDYRRLLADHPDLPAARAGLLGILIELERWGDARTELDMMVRTAPSDPHLRLLLSLAYESTADPTSAELELSTAHALGLTADQEEATRASIRESIRLRRERPPALPAVRASRARPNRALSRAASKNRRTRGKGKLSASS